MKILRRNSVFSPGQTGTEMGRHMFGSEIIRRRFSMKRTKFQRITAFVLALLFVVGGTLGASAAGDSVTNTTTSDIKELLNAISYQEYVAQYPDVQSGESEVVIDAASSYKFVAADGKTTYTETSKITDDKKSSVAHVDTFGGKSGLYLPSAGTVTWTTDKIASQARYNIVLEYYPIDKIGDTTVAKSASIERIFMINGEVPFAEARYLTISKIWKNTYPDGEFQVPAEESADTYLNKAAELGITARSETREGGTYIVYTMPKYWTDGVSEFLDDQAARFFTKDIDRNEIRSTIKQMPEWSEYSLKDANGFLSDPFAFVVTPDESGKVEFSLEAVNEPIVVRSIKLVPVEVAMSYADYIKQFDGVAEGMGKVKIEAEYYESTSTQTIYPIEDRTNPLNSPSSTDFTVLNTVGGEKWQTAGQWIKYSFKVSESGLYQITSKFRQNVLDGMYTSRSLYIYSDDTVAEGARGYYDGLPFAEAADIQFDYADEWQSGAFNAGGDPFEFYFEKGVVYTVKIEVSLGLMGDIVNRVQNSLNSINNDYLTILKLTGSNPDENRDYGFARVMPDTMIDLILQSRTLFAVAEEIKKVAGEASSMTATLEQVARRTEQMGSDEDAIAKNLEQLKTDIGSLGTWLNDAKTQPLEVDYFVIQGKSAEIPDADPSFWASLIHEIKSFIMSFFRNYDRMGAMEEVSEEDSVEVWFATGRDQAQVLRNLINNDFTPNTKIPVNLKLIAVGTLLPSILSGRGPDVYIGLAQSEVINYAIRGALIEIEDQKGYDEVIQNFNEAAMIVLKIEDSKGVMHTYGLPETQSFNMMFIREDIFADLDIEIPRTWDDVLEAIPVLQANNMEVGMNTDYKVHLYQKGGELYADGGMRINLDSNVALESFDTMCRFFTEYSFPYQYNVANRFRTGEMPIVFADYVATYNQLKVFATEIEGLWSFYPLPGYSDEYGNINNQSVSACSAIVLITGCKDVEKSWEFLKWHVEDDCQIDYTNEMVALIGPSAKRATANKTALASLPWTAAEYEQLSLQFNNLASIPNYPGSYIIDRYTNFAFLAAFNDSADPVTELLSYITTINKEITRKREEFDLETLDYVGQTLAQKRMVEAIALLEGDKADSAYKSEYDAVYNVAIEIMDGGDSEDFASIGAAADALEAANATLFSEAIAKMRSAVECLKSYEAYK